MVWAASILRRPGTRPDNMKIKLEAAIVVLTVIYSIAVALIYIPYYKSSYWLPLLRYPNLLDLSLLVERGLSVLSLALSLLGVWKLWKLKKIEIIGPFKFPLYYIFAVNIGWFVTTSLSTRYSFFILEGNMPWYLYLLKFLTITLLILTAIHFWNSRKDVEQKAQQEATKISRFINWAIDHSIIFVIHMMQLSSLRADTIFDNIPYLVSHSNWLYLLHMLCYYFVLEFLFLQTIGKLHNNSVVAYSDNRLKSIFVRTICRLIPFDGLSFLGKKGWHDSISDTTVLAPVKVETNQGAAGA